LIDVTVISVCSAKGAPGVTTISCAIAAVWPPNREIVVAECDPSGGDLAARFGLSAKRGMTSLVLDARHSTGTVAFRMHDHVQVIPGGLEILVGATGAGAARTVDSQIPDCLNRLLDQRVGDSEVVADLVLDCGRIQPGAVGQVAAIAASDRVLVVARPTVEAVASTRWIAERLSRAHTEGSSAGLVLVGHGNVPSHEAASVLDLELLAVVPEDGVGAAAMRGDAVRPGRLARSALVSSARALVACILELGAPANSVRVDRQTLSAVIS
jgi:MinD superfamily P-loop ATPase